MKVRATRAPFSNPFFFKTRKNRIPVNKDKICPYSYVNVASNSKNQTKMGKTIDEAVLFLGSDINFNIRANDKSVKT